MLEAIVVAGFFDEGTLQGVHVCVQSTRFHSMARLLQWVSMVWTKSGRTSLARASHQSIDSRLTTTPSSGSPARYRLEVFMTSCFNSTSVVWPLAISG